MPFKKGHPKPPTSGRKPGVPNKLTADARQRLEELGCDPIEGMAKIAADPKAPEELRGRMYAELAQYVYPKRKAVEHSGPNGTPIDLNLSGAELLTSRIAGVVARGGMASGDLKPDK